jgi:hypothetical protein
MEGKNKYALMVRGQPVDGYKGKLFYRKSKLKGGYKTLV